jgi:hypothetical protein
MHARAEPGELNKRVIDRGSASFVCDVYPGDGQLRVPHAGGELRPARCAVAPAEAAIGLAALLLGARRRRAPEAGR